MDRFACAVRALLCEWRQDLLKTSLTKSEIGTEIHYPVSMHRQKFFANPSSARKSLPNTEVLAKAALGIPIYPELKRIQQDTVIAAIATLVRG